MHKIKQEIEAICSTTHSLIFVCDFITQSWRCGYVQKLHNYIERWVCTKITYIERKMCTKITYIESWMCTKITYIERWMGKKITYNEATHSLVVKR